jgi:hypothetical protein
MRKSASDKLVTALAEAGVSEAQQRFVVNRVYGPKELRTVVDTDERKWAQLISELAAHIKSFNSNRFKAPAYTRPLIDEYYQLLRDTRQYIEATRDRLFKDPSNPHPDAPRLVATIAMARAARTKINDRLRAAGQPEGPSCGVHWQSWIAPSVRNDLIKRLEIAYVNAGIGPGRRTVLFVTAVSKKRNVDSAARLRSFFDDQRRVYATSEDGTRANNAFGALALCGIRMAERALEFWEKQVSRNQVYAIVNPLPVNWRHLLDQKMRERIAAADENPAAVTLDGLGSFYDEMGAAAP